jgi:hypothetical protein
MFFMKPITQPMRQQVLPCTCIVTTHPSHVHLMMCAAHLRLHMAKLDRRDNSDLVEASNLDLVGG